MFTRQIHPGSARKPARPEPVPNWCTLSKADQIEIQQQGKTIATGRVDILALDGSMLWIHRDTGNGRALFLRSDGVTVYRRPKTGATT
ncbi:hypothetical protein [Pseudarthrobacter sp. NamE5]|uniref:hypothetical protein n=1 Tax=Pseudarthrobacter sp. NamE5 TaxID=2576839 RepID=UPI00110AFC33|nr:hypothetical protein [Pseudarthrobacter sp. NamE5]TLM86043.1 hypothetical protein FDW84_07160 [Pseudarthrobacter sp. NamE5]